MSSHSERPERSHDDDLDLDPDVTDTGGPDAAVDTASATIVIDARDGAGRRLDQFVAGQLSQVSRTRVQRWIAIGAVRVDGALRLPSQRLVGIERIEVDPQPLESERAFAPDPVPLVIVYQDEDLIVIDKPAGLVTHPAPGHWRGTLMNGLLHADPAAAALPRAGIVHRLDRETSGLLVCARSERAFVSLSAQLAARTMGRRYAAIAEGRVTASGTVDAAIGRDPRQRLRMAVVDGPGGKPARTHYRPLGSTVSGDATGLLMRLETGRTHQIRVHMAHAGHPLVGDGLYGGRPRHGFARQALHAWRLAFEHPRDGRPCRFDSPLPPDLLALAADLGLVMPPTAPLDEADAVANGEGSVQAGRATARRRPR